MTTIAQVFEFESTPLRTVVVGEEPWFVATDVCTVLGFRMASDALRVLEEDEKGYAVVRTPGGDQRLRTVNESGLYALVFRSRVAGAKKFRRWVTTEVLPAIRKTGRYEVAQQVPKSLPEALRQYADEVEAHETTKAQLAIAAPKANYVSRYVDATEDVFTVNTVAGQFGVTEPRFRDYLTARKVIYRRKVGKPRWSRSKQKYIQQYEWLAHAKYRTWFTAKDQPEAPRLYNGQMSTTLYFTPVGKEGVEQLVRRFPIGEATDDIEGETR